MTKRVFLSLLGLIVLLVLLSLIWTRVDSATSLIPLAEGRASPNAKPIYNWRVCQDLGMGPVPGVPDQRQRFRLCHRRGWRVLAYCLQPNWPPPPIGRICTRINDNTYYCGSGIQNLREYLIQETPTATPSPTPALTSTSTPTLTNTPTSTATPVLATDTPAITQRPVAGGQGNQGQVGTRVLAASVILLITVSGAGLFITRIWDRTD